MSKDASTVGSIGRNMFLSYVVHAIVGQTVFNARPQNLAPSDIPTLSINKANGYLTMDRDQMVIRCEHVYVEIDWEKLLEDIKKD